MFWEFPGVGVEEKQACIAIGHVPLVSPEGPPGDVLVIWPESVSEMGSTGAL